MTCNKFKQNGFSLVEIIIVLAILTTSTAVTVPLLENRWC